MSALAPPAGGRALYCPCGTNWAALYGPRPFRDAAAGILARLGINRVPCVLCGGTIGAVPASSEARR